MVKVFGVITLLAILVMSCTSPNITAKTGKTETTTIPVAPSTNAYLQYQGTPEATSTPAPTLIVGGDKLGVVIGDTNNTESPKEAFQIKGGTVVPRDETGNITPLYPGLSLSAPCDHTKRERSCQDFSLIFTFSK